MVNGDAVKYLESANMDLRQSLLRTTTVEQMERTKLQPLMSSSKELIIFTGAFRPDRFKLSMVE